MSELFLNNQTFNDDISEWDLSSVTTTEKMFKFAEDFNQDLSGWDVSNVVYMNEMFYYATDFNQDIDLGMFQVLQIWKGCSLLLLILIKI